MNFQQVFQFLLGAIFAITSVQASPHFGLSPLNSRDLFVPTTCDAFVLGATQINIGQVCVGISGGTVTVTYPTLTPPNAYTDIHVYIGTAPPTNRAPGSFPYSLSNGCTISADGTTATCSIPVQSSWRVCESPLYIATHAAVTYQGQSQTGWGAGTCFGGTQGNCAKYWTFTTHCQCPVVYDYEPITSTVCEKP